MKIPGHFSAAINSYELIEKAVVAGFPMLATISAATTLAVDRAAEAGLTLIALARSDAIMLMTDGGARV